MQEIRPPAVAGAFYPEDPVLLKKEVNEFLANVPPPQITGEIRALIAPHAGYIYSGQVAAHAYKAVEGKSYSAVVIVAPSHYVPFDGASIYNGAGYQLPTGVVPVHQKLSQQIMQNSKSIKYLAAAHIREHSLEVQLPFLQAVMPGLKIVPIIQGNQSLSTCREIARAIVAGTKGENVLLVASSDLSHYHSYSKAVDLDKIVQDYINNFDPEGLANAIGNETCEACGAGPIITVMLAAKEMGANKAQVVKYANSGDVSGDKSRVVGYLAGVIYGNSSAQEKITPDMTDMGLSAEEKALLLKIAKTTIECGAKGTKMPEFEIKSPILLQNRGAFVTIKKRGHLRGCIGYIQAVKPLHKTIEEMAYAAAFKDPRFDPISEAELPNLELEISVLTPLKAINDVNQIQVGKHGLYLKKEYMSGLLLPQVATEYNWDRTTFLQQTCLKAGLPTNAWQDSSATIYIFSADIF